MLNTDIIDFPELGKQPWVLLGSGGYARKLIEFCVVNGIELPDFVVGICDATQFSNVSCIAPEEFVYSDKQRLVLGTDTFQMSIIERFKDKVPESTTFYDCGPFLKTVKNRAFFRRELGEIHDYQYDLLVDLNPAEHVLGWLQDFISWRKAQGVEIKVIHPLEKLSNHVLTSASHIYIWNGSVPVFKPLLKRLEQLNRKYSFMECGFFPQGDYFYIDDAGINNSRKLAKEKLLWVTDSMRKRSKALGTAFFDGIQQEQENYIFVPLQLQNDSNIQANSRFKNGMQEFIDFIEAKYPNEEIIFKKHPKDPLSYSCVGGCFSNEDSRKLILGSKLVHGINSTVLFEAALIGKPVIAEGECLLNHPYQDMDTVTAAIVASQYPVRGPFGVFCKGFMPLNTNDPKSVEQVGYA